jgi:hypothetical protein
MFIVTLYTNWTERSRVRFPALPDFLSSSGSGTGSSTWSHTDSYGIALRLISSTQRTKLSDNLMSSAAFAELSVAQISSICIWLICPVHLINRDLFVLTMNRTTIIFDVTQCSMLEVHQLFARTRCFHLQGHKVCQAGTAVLGSVFTPEDGGVEFFRNVGKFLP